MQNAYKKEQARKENTRKSTMKKKEAQARHEAQANKRHKKQTLEELTQAEPSCQNHGPLCFIKLLPPAALQTFPPAEECPCCYCHSGRCGSHQRSLFPSAVLLPIAFLPNEPCTHITLHHIQPFGRASLAD